MRRIAALVSALALSACTTLPASLMPARDEIGDFSIESRFALTFSAPEQSVQSGSGRLSWRHKGGNNQLLITNPLGFAIAEIETSPDHSQLRMADGKIIESADPDLLIEQVTGQRLPVTPLSRWLLGRADRVAEIDYDRQIRPVRLRESGWQVDYFYADDAPDALPNRLTLSYGKTIELRLRIESWQETP